MRNPLTIEIESRLAIIFLALLTISLLQVFFSVYNSYSQEVDYQMVTTTQIRTITQLQRNLIDAWILEHDIQIPADASRYRYMQRTYPDKPWAH